MEKIIMKTSTKAKGLSNKDKKQIKTMRELRKRGRSGKGDYWVVKEA